MTTSGLVFVCVLGSGGQGLWWWIFCLSPEGRGQGSVGYPYSTRWPPQAIPSLLRQRTYDCLLLILPPLREMEVEMVVSHHMDAKNQNLVFCKNTVLLPSRLVWFVGYLFQQSHIASLALKLTAQLKVI